MQNTGHDYPSFGADVSGMTIEAKKCRLDAGRKREIINKETISLCLFNVSFIASGLI
jgi:hypothetical protein